MSVGGGASEANSATQLDPEIKGDWQDLFNMTTAAGQSPTPQQQVAGTTAATALGQSMTLDAANAGNGALGQAIDTASNQAQGQGGIPVTAAVAGVNATQSTPDSQVMSYTPVTGASQGDLSPYMNPYQQQVVDTTMEQADLARQQDINSNQAGITASGGEGAWNGARAGVQNAQTNALIQGQEASQLAGLNQSNFTNAQSQAQAYGTLDQQAATTNQAAQLSKDNTIYQGDLTTNLANQSAYNTNQQNNAQLAQAASTSNQAEYEDELQRALTASGQLGTLSAQQQNQALTGAAAVTGVGTAQQAQTQSVDNADYTNAQNTRNEPIQTIESAFGIIPSTGSGSVTNSSGKSGQAGIG